MAARCIASRGGNLERENRADLQVQVRRRAVDGHALGVRVDPQGLLGLIRHIIPGPMPSTRSFVSASSTPLARLLESCSK